ncbi:hypothetical protein KP509_33G029800 [Ceratopteris richardii]|uniref:F-box domain-containing protein n=1 Tax=Ceratopteris richardii TaxID=49495 RepID=A0A8T2QMT1_CERRI|nr:hypothetical protein KP509_33G029800 [Ceratopteris richardii]
MGALFSTASRQPPAELASPLSTSCKRPRLAIVPTDMGDAQLIPGIPDELAVSILARVPRCFHSSIRGVCRRWRETVMSSELYEIRKELGVTEEWLYVLVRDEEENLFWHALDPVSGKWQRIPPMPDMLPEDEIIPMSASSSYGWWGLSSHKVKELLRGLFGRKDSPDKSPFCGCAAGSVGGCLYVLGGFSRASAMRSVWLYDPRVNAWKEVAAMGTPRAYCKTALLHGKLYAIGGVNRGHAGLTPLQSAEVYEPAANTWTPIPSMPFAKAQVLPTAFLADMLKPIATGMAAYQGKLFVPQSLYSWPFFVDVGGEVFDPMSEAWTEMPRGMGEGWPAKQAGTKLSVVVGESLYALDPTSSLDGSRIKVYDSETDSWKVVLRKTAPTSALSNCAAGEGLSETEPERWKTIASKNFGSVELVNCQVLDV